MADLFSSVLAHGGSAEIVSIDRRAPYKELPCQLGVGEPLATFRGKTIVIRAEQLAFAAILLDLDGIAERIVICPPDVSDEAIDRVGEEIRADYFVSDEKTLRSGPIRTISAGTPRPFRSERLDRPVETEWLMFTSGSTGVPKLVRHTYESLTTAFGTRRDEGVVWGTFYDIRRYGGLQILLRALVGGAPLILSDARESVQQHLRRLGAHGVTHLTGTPSHWRSALRSPDIDAISPRYVRLSGENVDQGILDALKARFPGAAVVHAFAATESGLAFEVHDGMAGFPSSFLGGASDPELRVVEGSLRIRSRRSAAGYAIPTGRQLRDPDGFVDTEDLVEIRGNRCYFLGRRSGVINIGGLKVHPEEVETVLNRHPKVLASLVRARKNPILGSIVAADVVLHPGCAPLPDESAFIAELIGFCRDQLGSYKAPALVRVVDSLKLSSAGKLARHG